MRGDQLERRVSVIVTLMGAGVAFYLGYTFGAVMTLVALIQQYFYWKMMVGILRSQGKDPLNFNDPELQRIARGYPENDV